MLAVIASIRKLEPQTEILFVCSGKDNEISLLKHSGIDYKIVPSGKYRRYGRSRLRELMDIKTQWQNLNDLPKILRGYTYSRSIIKKFKPDVVFVKGGYVGLPIGLAASQLKVPLVIHESDAIMGKTNQILSKKAQAVAVSFPPDTFDGIDETKLHYTGNPVRPEYQQAADETADREDKQRPNILVFAGSQGAEAINNVVFEGLELICKNFNILHVTGHQGIERARFYRHRLPAELRRNYEPYSFLTDEMIAAYHWSDLVVARAGMNSLSEIAALSKPAIIIPLPSSTNNHQLANAQYLARQGAIRMLLQEELTGVRLVEEVSKLMGDHSSRLYLAESIHKFYKPSSAVDIARLIIANGSTSSTQEGI